MPVPVALALAARQAAVAVIAEAGEQLLGAAVSEGGRRLCNAHANNPGVVGSLGATAAGFVNGMCNAYYGANGITPPSAGVPFSGGQCPGVQYNVQSRGVSQGGNESITNVVASGPLGAIVVTQTGPNSNGFFTLRFDLPYSTDPEPRPVRNLHTYLWDGVSPKPTASITSVSRQDGQPDNCGNLPTVYTPSPNAPVQNYNQTNIFNAPFSGNVEITVGSPTLNIDGSLNLPVTVGDVTVDFGDGSSIPASSEGGLAPSDRPVSAGSPVTGAELAADNGDFPPPPEGFEYVGALFAITQTPGTDPPLPGSVPAPVYARTLGNARLKMSSGGGQIFPSENHQWREGEFSLLRPVSGVTVEGAYANMLEGWSFSVTPLLIPIEA